MVSDLLLRVSVVLLLVGMALGMVMGIQQNFLLAPAHAHLNLVGFVTMFLAGIYYRFVPEAAEGMLPKVQAVVHITGAIVFPLGIAAVLSWGPGYEAAAIGGAWIVLIAILLFAVIVFRTTTAQRRISGALVPGE
jgi:peptidoglycan/LPS O-acetylase OafA/YrhL